MGKFNGVHLLTPNLVSVQVVGDACPMGFGSWNPSVNQYFSQKFPLYLQDPKLPIHLKEFICVILAVRVWGSSWAGKTVQFFCDNDSVVEVICNLKPKNDQMQRYLREFLFHVCTFNFHPIVSKIGTKENDVADFLSRNFSEDDATSFFKRENLCPQEKIFISEDLFHFSANW